MCIHWELVTQIAKYFNCKDAEAFVEKPNKLEVQCWWKFTGNTSPLYSIKYQHDIPNRYVLTYEGSNISWLPTTIHKNNGY